MIQCHLVTPEMFHNLTQVTTTLIIQMNFLILHLQKYIFAKNVILFVDDADGILLNKALIHVLSARIFEVKYTYSPI